ncbi:MAG: HNH endonuclease signature motif containing protein [Pantoea sp.]|nr:HNH endonuclease signature motif containing protein [Pantoea sp.]
MIYEGEVVMLDTFLTSSYPLFYINDQGELICRDPLTFHINGAENIIREYHRSVARRDYRNKGGKPRPTAVSVPNVTQQPAPPATINSKMAGRLLAAGGIYHQNPEKYAETAHKLGGAAAEGFDEVLNEQTLGSLVALSSIVMLVKASVAGHPSAATLAELKRYLGKTKGEAKLLDNITVVKLDYKRRDRDELARLRRQFQKVKPKFYKALAIHPTVKKRFNADELEKMAKGMRPNNEWEIHHKIPLDDGGTNNFQNLTLIHKDAHKIFTKAQKTITRQQSKHEVSEVLWAVPTGVVYP